MSLALLGDHWGAVEADFQREYGIDLLAGLDGMSWRRFLVLLQGLSAGSWWAKLLEDDKPKSARGRDVIVVDADGF